MYPHFEELNITPDYLTIGASAMRGLLEYGWLERKLNAPHVPAGLLEKRSHAKQETTTRVYTSRFVGVSRNKAAWVCIYKDDTGRTRVGTRRPYTDEGERQAAWDYARARGLDYIERRDGEHEPLY